MRQSTCCRIGCNLFLLYTIILPPPPSGPGYAPPVARVGPGRCCHAQIRKHETLCFQALLKSGNTKHSVSTVFPCCRSRNTVGGPLRTCNCCDRCLYPSHAFGEWKHETQNTSVLFHAARSAARKMAKNTSCRGKTTETRGRPSRKHGNTVTQTPLAELETRKHRNTDRGAEVETRNTKSEKHRPGPIRWLYFPLA